RSTTELRERVPATDPRPPPAHVSTPTGNRTPVSWLRTRCPRPLDDGGPSRPSRARPPPGRRAFPTPASPRPALPVPTARLGGAPSTHRRDAVSPFPYQRAAWAARLSRPSETHSSRRDPRPSTHHRCCRPAPLAWPLQGLQTALQPQARRDSNPQPPVLET